MTPIVGDLVSKLSSSGTTNTPTRPMVKITRREEREFILNCKFEWTFEVCALDFGPWDWDDGGPSRNGQATMIH